MDTERKGGTTFKGNPLTLIGNEVKVGQTAPDFSALAGDLSPVTLASSKGKTRLFVAVPSLDTPVCDAETRRFNEEAAKMPGVDVWVISMDLPFAQGRFCQTAGIKNVKCLSDHRDASFGKAYGTLIKELRLLSRAIFVVDANDKVQYVEYVKEVTSHPDYQAALDALKQGARA
ncbi:MAG: lipid hydroperoxide peroxidase [Elusimicrobia bacterium RIFCSPLOWO2_01_FULL_59_12]|nr:MAG: lipid hydroperoxide peroxidase [Elusimicrobia bacterium RIFCSPLOWO2_01_FULL_59_12]